MRLHVHKGFTLLEYLLYITIASVILLAGADLTLRFTESKAKLESVQEVAQNGRGAMTRMTTAVRNASGISTPGTGSSGSYLQLTTSNANTNPTSFGVSSGTLQMKEGSSASSSITTDDVYVRSVLFQNLTSSTAPGVIRIQLNVSSTNAANDPDYDYSQIFYGTAVIRQRL
jgi:type II secretory pathway pseudopilin PulG